MINHGKVESAVKPENTVMDEFSVWIASNIEEVTKTINDDGAEATFYTYDLVQYTKDEYIAKVSESNKNLEAQLLETQSGLTEIYEQMLSAASV